MVGGGFVWVAKFCDKTCWERKQVFFGDGKKVEGYYVHILNRVCLGGIDGTPIDVMTEMSYLTGLTYPGTPTL